MSAFDREFSASVRRMTGRKQIPSDFGGALELAFRRLSGQLRRIFSESIIFWRAESSALAGA